MRNRPQPKWLVPLFRLLTYQLDKADVCNVQYAMPPTVFVMFNMQCPRRCLKFPKWGFFQVTPSSILLLLILQLIQYILRFPDCGKVFAKRKGWLKHDLTHGAKNTCSYCGIAVGQHQYKLDQFSLKLKQKG